MPAFDLEQVFKAYDLSGDGFLDFKEFGQMFTQKTGMISDEAISPAKNDPYLQEKERQQILEMMKSSESVDLSKTVAGDAAQVDVDISDLSEWEQKLAKIEKG